jgi:6-phosphofructokinase 1
MRKSMDGNSDVLLCPTLRDVLEPRPSPFMLNNYHGGGFVSDEDRVDLQAVHFASRRSAGVGSQTRLDALGSGKDVGGYLQLPPCALRAGPRSTIYVNPVSAQVAIVTCGGLCPGLNDVVRGIVLKCIDYGVPEKNIIGIRNGFHGFYSKKYKPIALTRKMVDEIQLEGGTVLGTSRERADIREVVKRLDLWKIDMLFVIGGPGSHAGAVAIQNQCSKSRVPCLVVAVPKSIDNDILLIDKTFGFETAVEEAQNALMAAKVEAGSGYRGVGLVKLMGRRSGFIAVQASLASGLVDICLIPEVPFRVDAVMAYLETILERKGHAVICIAEGAAQDLMAAEGLIPQVSGITPSAATAASTAAGFSSGGDGDGMEGHPYELHDVGAWLKSAIKRNCTDVDVKYIDPSYLIRSVPTRTTDRVLCRMLANGAVHAAMAGYTGVTVGLVNTHFVYLPIPLVIQAPRKVDPNGELWNRLRSSISQPPFDQPPPLRASSLSPVSTPGREW